MSYQLYRGLEKVYDSKLYPRPTEVRPGDYLRCGFGGVIFWYKAVNVNGRKDPLMRDLPVHNVHEHLPKDLRTALLIQGVEI